MAYKITGSVLAIGPTQTLSSKSGNTYTKRDLIISVRLFDPYTGQPIADNSNTPKFTFIGEKCATLDQFSPGNVVTISFDISGRSYDKDGKTEYFTEIRPFRIDYNRPSMKQQPAYPQQQETIIQQAPPATPYGQQSDRHQNPYPTSTISSTPSKDDLPFN